MSPFNKLLDTRRLELLNRSRTFLYGECLKVRSNEVDESLVDGRLEVVFEVTRRRTRMEHKLTR